VTGEREVAVGCVVVHRGVGDLPGHRGRRNVGVEVLQPEQIGVAGRAGGIADLVHADPRDVRQSRDGHDVSMSQRAAELQERP
jgi:hypothetical protein